MALTWEGRSCLACASGVPVIEEKSEQDIALDSGQPIGIYQLFTAFRQMRADAGQEDAVMNSYAFLKKRGPMPSSGSCSRVQRGWFVLCRYASGWGIMPKIGRTDRRSRRSPVGNRWDCPGISWSAPGSGFEIGSTIWFASSAHPLPRGPAQRTSSSPWRTGSTGLDIPFVNTQGDAGFALKPDPAVFEPARIVVGEGYLLHEAVADRRQAKPSFTMS